MNAVSAFLDGVLRGQGAVLGAKPAPSAAQPESIARSTRAQIDLLVAAYDNPDTVCADFAIEAARAGRPAFWKRTKYHNAVVGLVCSNVNAGGDLSTELANWCTDTPHGRPLAVLRQLIPLNVAATVVLREAIARAEWQEAEHRNIERKP